jgi:hypothetical protein
VTIVIDGEEHQFPLTREHVARLAATNLETAKYAQALLDDPDVTIDPQHDTTVDTDDTQSSTQQSPADD